MRTPDLNPQEDEVLRLLASGTRSGQIAKLLKLTPGRVSQIITSLVKKRILVRLPRSSYQPYQLTLLAQEIFSVSREGREKLNTPTYNGLHRISFRLDVQKFPTSFHPDRYIDLNNWKQGILHFPNLEIRVNTTCLECWWDERQVSDPIDAEEMATLRASLIQRDLEKAGFIFKGIPIKNRQWKHSIDDPVIQGLDPGYLKGKDFLVDNTPKPNTLHLSDAEKVRDHLDTPKKVERLESLMNEGFSRLYSLLETSIETNNKLIEKFTPKEIDPESPIYG